MAGKKSDELNQKQKLFCALYASDREFFGNGVEAYAEAYNIDRNKPNWYSSAGAAASRLLKDGKILDEINKQLDLGGLNDATVDKELLFVIRQHSDYGAKTAAIREYNKLKQRIITKTDVTSGGKPIPLLHVLHNNDSNGKD